MAVYMKSEEGCPICSNCGAVMPECGANATNINPSQIKYCYKCGQKIVEPYFEE